MASGFPVYRHHSNVTFAVLAIILVAIAAFVLIVSTEVAFQKIGFSRLQVILLLVGTFLGSMVNIPLVRVKSTQSVVKVEQVRYFWITYRIPRPALERVSTVIAVNLGGAIIPVGVSLYLLYGHTNLLFQALLGILITTIIVHLVARRVPGVGIATPAFIPPIVAAIAAYIIAPTAPGIVAYASGTLGTLIGADITNLGNPGNLGAPVVSIGGAGTFDGIFLSGILAVLLI